MGRLINETDLMNLLCALDDARHDLCYAIKKIPELPTVEAIPKDQYEARLKADMVVMLDKISVEIEAFECWSAEDNSDGYDKYIEQYEVLKIIDNYKAESEVNNGNDD